MRSSQSQHNSQIALRQNVGKKALSQRLVDRTSNWQHLYEYFS